MRSSAGSLVAATIAASLLEMAKGVYHEFRTDWPESMTTRIKTSNNLRDVRYEIRGQLAQHAQQMERRGYEIISMNIGNPGLFGFRTPEIMRMAMIENLPTSEAYCHQKGIFPSW